MPSLGEALRPLMPEDKDELEEPDDEEGEVSSAGKLDAVRSMMSAVKSDDAEAFASALDDYIDLKMLK